MRALILAAGLGSRLRPLTNEIPKALVEVKGHPILAHQINSLVLNGVKDITIVTGYKHKVLEKFLEQFSDVKFKLIHNNHYENCSSAYSAMLALAGMADDYIHINCDILFSASLVGKLLEDKRKNILCVRGDIELTNSMENAIGLNGRIVNMSLKPSNEAKYKAFGIGKISKEGLIQNINFYNSLTDSAKNKENYYGLIRVTLGFEDYFYIESDKKNLAEVNSIRDLEKCEFISDLT